MVGKKISGQLLSSYEISAFHESFHFIFTTVLLVGGIIISILQMRSLRHGEAHHLPKAIE